MMIEAPRPWLVLFLLLVLAGVFIAPTVDLQPTALRAWQAAALLFLGIYIAGRAVLGGFQAPMLVRYSLREAQADNWALPADSRLLELHCTRLC